MYLWMSLREQLKGLVDEEVLSHVPNSFDVIGNIAITSFPEELEAYKGEIAGLILKKRGNLRTVLNKVSKMSGDHRVADFEILLGNSTETVHRENGYAYNVDVRKSFFNPRPYSERARVAAQVRPGENVIIPFAGVGPFVLPAAGKGAFVLAIEKNPEACTCLKENIRLNRLEDRILALEGDADEISKLMERFWHSLAEGILSEFRFLQPEPERAGAKQQYEFDRAIIPTPYGMDHFLEKIAQFVRIGGLVHYYTFKKEYQIPGLIEAYEKMGFEVRFYRRCGNIAPGVSRWAFDLLKTKREGR